jgi:hypothetical protein
MYQLPIKRIYHSNKQLAAPAVSLQRDKLKSWDHVDNKAMSITMQIASTIVVVWV